MKLKPMATLAAAQEAFAAAIKSCAETKNLASAKQIEDTVVRGGVSRDRYLANLLVYMYGRCGAVEEARRVFEGIDPGRRNYYSWNLLLSAYAQNGHLLLAKAVFDAMKSRTVITWTSILQSYAQAAELEQAQKLFERMPQRDVISWNVMITVYTQEGHLLQAEKLFYCMPERSLATWNATIALCLQGGLVSNATLVFDRMPCHNVVSWSTMVEVYAQKGNVEMTRQVFERMPERNIISWSALLAAYAQGGHGKEAMEVFGDMILEGLEPDGVAFVNLLVGCGHVGTVEACRQYFLSMVSDFDLTPIGRHYCCIVDALGRAGKLLDAEELVDTMPFLPTETFWRCLLSSCKTYHTVKLGTRVAKELSLLDPDCSSLYLLVRNLENGIFSDTMTGVARRYRIT